MKVIIIAIATSPFLVGNALADNCQTASFADSQTYQTALAKKKIYFQDDKGKPTASYIIKGDEVVVVSQQAGKACVDFSTSKSETSGWVALSDLGPLRKQPSNVADWEGTFQRDEFGSSIELTPQKDGKVRASGDAYWAMSAESAKNGALHDGSIEDVGEVKDGAAHIGSAAKDGTDCSVDLRLLSNHYLIATNQGVGYGDDAKASGCWGANVTFEGLYVRVNK
jgi:hypothetical protein